jgi:hypothetical protein
VTESLATFQSDLGRALRGEDACPIDPRSAGFRFTMQVRHSWRKGRAMLAARTILSALGDDERQKLLDEYVDHGGGLEIFLAKEAECFLAFLEPRLPDPSHALTLCYMQQALYRARLGASTFMPSRRPAGTCLVRRGRHGSLIRFHADPGALLMALNGGSLPPVGLPDHAVLFGPGMPNLFRTATDAEAELWASLPLTDASPRLIAPLLAEGVVEYSDVVDERACTRDSSDIAR